MSTTHQNTAVSKHPKPLDQVRAAIRTKHYNYKQIHEKYLKDGFGSVNAPEQKYPNGADGI